MLPGEHLNCDGTDRVRSIVDSLARPWHPCNIDEPNSIYSHPISYRHTLHPCPVPHALFVQHNHLLSPLAHSANSFLCFRMSTNPGLASNTANGFPLKSFSTSPFAFLKPSAPSRSILPAHTSQRTGLSFGEPRTRPKTTIRVATMVSMVMSRGSDGVATEGVVEWEEMAEERTACSWAE